MKAADFNYKVGDRVKIVHAWGEDEEALIVHINDGPEVDEVELEFGGGDSYGIYGPEDIHPWTPPRTCQGYGPEQPGKGDS